MQRPRVETRSGVIEGVVENDLVVLRGVPFAAAPVGALRWEPPRREPTWSGVRDASASGLAAPQRSGLAMRMLGLESLAQDEDCLTLQVWTPGLDARRRAVMVWLHGGAFTSGSGSLPLFDGTALARRGDAVVVTVNYRLGALGFLAHASGELSANFGLLDQIAALGWVREHADRLGGDPDNVTLFGESAGAMSIGALLGAPAARGLFRRAILQSGAAHNVSSRESALRIAALFREAAGLPQADREALRALDAERVLEAQQRVVDESWRHVEGLAFQPAADGRVIPRAPLDAIDAGAAAGIELLVGTNLDEWRLFALADAKLRGMDADGLVRRLVRVPPGAAPDPQALALEAIETYRRARDGALPTDPASLWLAMQTDRIFRVPAIRLAERQGRHASVFMYRFDWSSPAFGGLLGSCHGLEIPFVFGTLGHERAGDLVGRGEAAERLARTMQDAWLAFARGGDPGWPAYEPGKRATRLFGPIGSSADSGLDFDPMGAERAFWDGRL
jgi:para-nitrobenzyl esterase